MDAFVERLIAGAATIDEILSDAFETPNDGSGDADLAARRIEAWRRAAAAGDAALFDRRLARDGFSAAAVAQRLASARPRMAAPVPAWVADALWIDAAFRRDNEGPAAEACAFAPVFAPVVEHADGLLWSGLPASAQANLTDAARGALRAALLRALSELCAAPLYERFAAMRKAARETDGGAFIRTETGHAFYDRFIDGMKSGGLRQLFEDKPVLLRLIAVVTRQWIDTGREFLVRLDADLPLLRRAFLAANAGRVAAIEGDHSDPHNNGRSVLIVGFENGDRVVYKPKDLRIDVAWRALLDRLNGAGAPIDLKAVHAIARDGYGWTEFIGHASCADRRDCARFFHRAGAWLALFHMFVATDMHQENMIAQADHPVPIDLETILQPSAEEHKANAPESAAFDAAMEIVANTVMTVGLLPAYGRGIYNGVFAMGGMTADWTLKTVVKWHDINSDAMRPAKAVEAAAATPNLPHVDGRYARFGDHIDDFIAGFADYALFLRHQADRTRPATLFDGFASLPVRKIIRPTRFYYMLLRRLKNHQAMNDGAIWSAQADFIARVAPWDQESDPLWPLQRAERRALLALNVPHFVSPSDGGDIADADGARVKTAAVPGLQRAVARLEDFDADEITWQVEVIRENTTAIANGDDRIVTDAPAIAALSEGHTNSAAVTSTDAFLAEADRIADELAARAIRRGPGAAWIGLDWLGDSEVSQLVCLGPDLYNGASGIALFLAAHAAVTGSVQSSDLAKAGLAHLRRTLRSGGAARMARTLGIGAATGLGSVLYALTVIARCIGDETLRADALAASALITDDLIAADTQLDVMGGSAGAILALLRLHRDTGSAAVLERAAACGMHVLRQSRTTPDGHRSWVGPGAAARPLNGMSHGAAGFAYALAALAEATGLDDFAQAAAQSMAFENARYDEARHNWPDLRNAEPLWPCQWCHGAVGIGLARLATAKKSGPTGMPRRAMLQTDISRAADATIRSGIDGVDTLCCGALGRVEFLCEAGDALRRADLHNEAMIRLRTIVTRAAAVGDYRWNNGKRQFNLGLFRGLAGVGYTLLRRCDRLLPNVLIWE